MKNLNRIVVAVAGFAMAAGLVAAFIPLEAAPPDRTTRTVELDCKAGWRGGAGGQYGGVPFSLSCGGDKQSVEIEGTSGTAYSVRMGAESIVGAYDCFFSGDAARVNETCVAVKITIR